MKRMGSFTNTKQDFKSQLMQVGDATFHRIKELLHDLETDEMLAVVEMYLPWKRIGLGSYRAVFEMRDDLVIKVAIDLTGVQETESEASVYRQATELGFEEHLVKAHYADLSFVVQERLKVFKSAEEFAPYVEEAVRIIELLRQTDADVEDLIDDGKPRFDQLGLRGDTLVVLDYGFEE